MVVIEEERSLLQDPATRVVSDGQVGFKHESRAHGVPPGLGYVHRGREGVLDISLGRPRME